MKTKSLKDKPLKSVVIDSVGDSVEDCLWWSVRGSVRMPVENSIRMSVYDSVRNSIKRHVLTKLQTLNENQRS